MDFSNRQNRMVKLSEVSEQYLADIKASTKQDPFYPSYHIAPHHGLINDPNGLSFFNGRHHIFYQWFPLGPVHGLKHWYHVSTKDYVHFEDHGVAMYPDSEFDQNGCHTGVGVVENDTLHLLYTGHYLKDGQGYPTQMYATMDTSGKLEKHGVVVDYNHQQYTENFRDPVIFTRGEDYYMAVGAESHDNKGRLALYRGQSLDSYEFLGNVSLGLDDFGYMWECPNYYEEGDNGVLILSPQGVSSESKYDLKNVFSVVYMVGNTIDTDSLEFDHQGYVELDKGFDFYAPQTYLDDKGRRILIGWLGNSKSAYPTDKNSWAHMLTLPRELVIDGPRLRQYPLEELKALRKGDAEHSQTGFALLSRAFELNLNVEETFELAFENEAGERMTFAGDAAEFCLDRTHVSHTYAEQFGTVRYAKREQGEQTIRVFVDNSAIEIFCDDGLTVFTSRIFIDDLSKVTLQGATAELFYLDGIQSQAVQ